MARESEGRDDLLAQLAEVFRNHGYEGASLSAITAATGLGKGSLYHFFPGGKEQMAEEVLGSIEAWFEHHVFQPLEGSADAREGVLAMLDAVESYFQGGQRVCLIGAFALDATRDRFSSRIDTWFEAWTAALETALERLGRKPAEALAEAERMLALIQGGLVMARARNDRAVFSRIVAGIRASL